jgi:hypothetical protein
MLWQSWPDHPKHFPLWNATSFPPRINAHRVGTNLVQKFHSMTHILCAASELVQAKCLHDFAQGVAVELRFEDLVQALGAHAAQNSVPPRRVPSALLPLQVELLEVFWGPVLRRDAHCRWQRRDHLFLVACVRKPL